MYRITYTASCNYKSGMEHTENWTNKFKSPLKSWLIDCLLEGLQKTDRTNWRKGTSVCNLLVSTLIFSTCGSSSHKPRYKVGMLTTSLGSWKISITGTNLKHITGNIYSFRGHKGHIYFSLGSFKLRKIFVRVANFSLGTLSFGLFWYVYNKLIYKIKHLHMNLHIHKTKY